MGTAKSTQGSTVAFNISVNMWCSVGWGIRQWLDSTTGYQRMYGRIIFLFWKVSYHYI